MATGKYTRTPAHVEHLRRAAQIRNGTLGLTPSERFLKHVHKTATCWLWCGTVKAHGYGVIRIDTKLWRAHRLSWSLFAGPIPDGKSVLHRCDNTRCVNPNHLFIGTQLDNVKDMDAKGRGVRENRHPAKGEAHGRAKLAEDQVAEIRHAHCHGARQVDLARIYGISQATVSAILNRKIWK